MVATLPRDLGRLSPLTFIIIVEKKLLLQSHFKGDEMEALQQKYIWAYPAGQ